MDKVLQAVGTLLIVSILFIAILTYLDVANVSPVLQSIKSAVDQLIAWLVPQKFSMEIIPYNVSGVTIKVSGNTFARATGTFPAGTTSLVAIHVRTDKDVRLFIRIKTDIPSASFTVSTYGSYADAVVKSTYKQGNETIFEVVVYPVFELPPNVAQVNISKSTVGGGVVQGDAFIDVAIQTTSTATGTVDIAVSVART